MSIFENFEAKLRTESKSIVFTEGTDARILSAASRLLAGKTLRVILLGEPEAVKKAKKESDKLTPKQKKELSEEEKEYKSKRKMIQEKLIKFAARIPVFMYLTARNEYRYAQFFLQSHGCKQSVRRNTAQRSRTDYILRIACRPAP